MSEHSSCTIFHQNDFGYTARCQCHQEVQLVFGNVALLLALKDFLGLKKHVQHTYQHFAPANCMYCKNIVIDTTVRNMSFVFSYWELENLYDIMESTALMLEVEGILQPKA